MPCAERPCAGSGMLRMHRNTQHLDTTTAEGTLGKSRPSSLTMRACTQRMLVPPLTRAYWLGPPSAYVMSLSCGRECKGKGDEGLSLSMP
jgi:hypothetical protein